MFTLPVISARSGHGSLVAFSQTFTAQQLNVPEVLSGTAVIVTAVEIEYIARLWKVTVHAVLWEFGKSEFTAISLVHYAEYVCLLHLYKPH
jgi:hypothetical protein